MILEWAALYALSFAAGYALGYLVCEIVVPYLRTWNIRDVSKNALSSEAETKKYVGRMLNAVVKDKSNNGGIATVTLDVFDDDANKIAEVRIKSEDVDDDIYVGRRFDRIAI